MSELDLLPFCVDRIAGPTACADRRFLSVGGAPSKRSGAFDVVVHGLPGNGQTFLLLGLLLPNPVPMLNIDLDLSVLMAVPAAATPTGLASTTFPIGVGVQPGVTLGIQVVSLDPGACGPLQSAGTVRIVICP